MTLRRIDRDAVGVDHLVAFCAAHPVDSRDTKSDDLMRRLLTSLTRGPEGVVVLEHAGEVALVGGLVDTVQSSFDCGVAEILGWRRAVRLEPLAERLFADVETWARSGPRVGIETPLGEPLRALVPMLERRGYAHAFDMYVMETPAQPPPPSLPLPGAGWRWEDATLERAADHHAAVEAAFVGTPGSYTVDFEEFCANVAKQSPPTRLLLCGDRVAGFARVVMIGSVGCVGLVGRHPDFRGRGLGPLLLTEAMQTLGRLGAERFLLDVSAANSGALDLYLRFGFEVVERQPFYRLIW